MSNGPQHVKLLSPAAIAAALLLAGLNFYICRDLFRTEYLHQMDSIEGSYIGISRYILAHPRNLTWFPLWYGGIPFQNTYPPLLHLLVAGTAWLFKISPALAHHVVGAAFYCLGPVALMFLAYALSNNFKLSFVSGLVYSLLSPSTFLLPSVRLDLGSFWNPRRLHTLVHYGDGPHVSAITLVLFAILALHLAIERRGPMRVFVAVIALAAVVLTNWLGAFSLAIGCVSYLLARSKQDSPRNSTWARTLAFSALIGALAYGLASPWIPPSTIAAVQRNAQFTVGRYPMGVRQLEYAGVLLVLIVILRWALMKARSSLCVRFSSYFFLITGALALPAEWLHIYLMPQPDRYHLEMEIGLCLLLVFGLAAFAIKTFRNYQVTLVIPLVVLAVIQARHYRRYEKRMVVPIDIHQTVEYQSARWLQENLPNRRIFTQGSIRFWLNAFSDTPQTGGGFDQGLINPEVPILQFGIPYTTDDGVRTATWLRLFGAEAVVVSGPKSRDAYPNDWRDPNKFAGILPELWRNGDDAIYGVPQRSKSLAHVILPTDAVSRSPINVVDVEPLQKLAAAFENPSLPIASFEWKNPAEALISGVLEPQQAVYVQITYHPGWRAFVNGSTRSIRKDGLNFSVIEPQCSGPCQIQLRYDGGTEMRIAHWVSALTVFGFLFALALQFRSRFIRQKTA